MTEARDDALAARLAELRRAFDESFGAAPTAAGAATEAGEELLALAVGGVPCAVRLAEIDGLESLPVLAPLPDGPPGLVGLAGVRGLVLPVWSLAALTGLSTANTGATAGAGALLLRLRDGPLGLLADLASGGFRARISELDGAAGPASEGAASPSAPRLVTDAGVARRLLSLASILAEVRRRAGLPVARKEE